MSNELNPITQLQKLTLGEEQLKQVLIPKYWLNLPHKSERDKIRRLTIEILDPKNVDKINNQVQKSLNGHSKLVYKTDRNTFVLDSEKSIYYSLNSNHLIQAQFNTFKSISIPVYSGQLDAKLSLSQYLAFFNVQVGDYNFVHRFYHQDINTIPLIYSVNQNSQKQKLIFGPNPYIENSMIIGTPHS